MSLLRTFKKKLNEVGDRQLLVLQHVSQNDGFAFHHWLLYNIITWWRHQMEAFPRYWSFVWSERPVTQSFDLFFDVSPNERLRKQRCWWFETQSHSLWRHCNALTLWNSARILTALKYAHVKPKDSVCNFVRLSEDHHDIYSLCNS